MKIPKKTRTSTRRLVLYPDRVFFTRMDTPESGGAAKPLAQARVYVGACLRARREAAKLNQQQVAVAMGVPQPYISAWERGRWMPNITQLWRLCEVLHCTMNDLVGLPGQATGTPIRPAR